MAARRKPLHMRHFKSDSTNDSLVEWNPIKTPFDQYLEMTTSQRATQIKDNLQLNIFDSLLNPVVPKLDTKVCHHQWTSYVGFTESYEFCIHCDCKKK